MHPARLLQPDIGAGAGAESAASSGQTPAEARVQRWYQGAPSPFDCTQTRPKLPRLAR